MHEKIIILGDGAWATTLAILLKENDHKVSMWSAFPDYLKEALKKGKNERYLPGVKFSKEIVFEEDINEAIEKSDIIVDAIPSKFYRDVLKKIKADVSGKIFVNVSKGIEIKGLKRMTEIAHEELGRKIKTCVLSGPTIAPEVARRMPAVAVASSLNFQVAKRVQNMFFSPAFRVYTNNDPVGVELGGALKNIVAIVAGISDGLGFGANTKAAILSRGIKEIERFGSVFSAKKKTFYGIAGLGDLSTTCISSDSRNRTLGERIGRGEKLEDILNSSFSVVEGVTTTKAVYNLAKKKNIDMPMTEQAYLILYHNKNPQKALEDLMKRDRKTE